MDLKKADTIAIPENSVFIYCLLLFLLLFTGGCSSMGKVTNIPVQKLPVGNQRYSFSNHIQHYGFGNIIFILSFSGGGARASALSYGVLEELQNTTYDVDGRKVRLLDEIDKINGVSGGSFTAAYYGLFGDNIFSDFKNDFLYKDIEGELKSSVFNIFNLFGRLFSEASRTEDAIRVYDRNVFKNKTFLDLQSSGNPFVLINATDLNSHDLFVFSQDYFDFLCSDLSSFSVSRAVTASSAVPIIFDPVFIENHHDCSLQKPDWLVLAEQEALEDNNTRLKEVINSFEFYFNPANPPFATLVDGGVTDNLGLRAILGNTMLFDKTTKREQFLQQRESIEHVVVLLVNASTTSPTNIGKSKQIPSFSDVLSAVTEIQLHRYNLETTSLLKEELKDWVESVAESGKNIKPHYIEVSIDDAKGPELRLFFNKIPTSLALEKDQVDRVIETAKRLLREDPGYQQLLKDLGAGNTVGNNF